MASPNGHRPPERNPGPPTHPKDAQTLSYSDYDRLWRIAFAVELIAVLPVEAAKVLGITADHTSAVAAYISDDLRGILSRVKPADE